MTDATIRVAFLVLGAVVLACIVLAGLIVLDDKPVPDTLLALGSVALGIVGGAINAPRLMRDEPEYEYEDEPVAADG